MPRAFFVSRNTAATVNHCVIKPFPWQVVENRTEKSIHFWLSRKRKYHAINTQWIANNLQHNLPAVPRFYLNRRRLKLKNAAKGWVHSLGVKLKIPQSFRSEMRGRSLWLRQCPWLNTLTEKMEKIDWGKCLGLPHTGYGPEMKSLNRPLFQNYP